MTDAVRVHEASVVKELMPLADAVELSRELARRLRALARPADVVVAIAEGGLLPGRVVADELGLPLHVMRVRRGGSVVKEQLARVPGLARAAVAASRTPVLGALVRGALHAVDAAAHGAGEAELEPTFRELAGARAVLVDDAQQRGGTLRRARSLLEQAGVTCVASGVLTWSQEGSMEARAPDAWIGRRLQHYPWSGGSPARREYRRWLSSRGLAAHGLLLLDLDGVLVAASDGDVLRAHADAPGTLTGLGAPVVVVTHRSRVEARQLLAALGLACPAWAAEDLWLAGLARQPLRLLRRGTSKAVAVGPMSRRHELDADDVVALDDREDVLADYVTRGAGLAMLAPSASTAAGTLRTFDLAAALQLARDWWSRDRDRAEPGRLVRLPAIELLLPSWARTGRTVAPPRVHGVRRIASRLRRLVAGQ